MGASLRFPATLAACALLASASPASGAQITFAFTATVESLFGPSEALDALDGFGVEPGAAASGTLTFDLATPDQLPDDDLVGDYPGAILGVAVQIAGYDVALDPGAPGENRAATIYLGSPDSVYFYASVLDEPDLSLPPYDSTFLLWWFAPDFDPVLADDSLLATPPDLGIFSAGAEVTGFSACAQPGSNPCNSYTIRLQISSLTAVPEPASGTLLGLGLLGAGAAGRARRHARGSSRPRALA